MESAGPGPGGLAGAAVGPYDILERIGAGGMGEVYLAHDRRLGRRVAIKALGAALFGDDNARKRFLREGRLACQVAHPYVASIHGVVEHGSELLLVMEHVDGRPLTGVLREGRPDERTVLRWGREIAEAMAAIHRAGLVHRDVKPGNVMIARDGHVKVLDFGLAQVADPGPPDSAATTRSHESSLTAPGATVGTLLYMSPEQLRGEPLDARSDLFSLGVVLYEALDGRHPFARRTAAESAAAILHESPGASAGPPSGASDRARRIVLKLLEKRREDRHASADDLARELEDALERLAPPRPPFSRAVLVRIAAGAALLAAAAAGAAYWAMLPPVWGKPRYAVAIAPFGDQTGAERGLLESAMLADLLTVDLESSRLVRVAGPDETQSLLSGASGSAGREAARRVARGMAADYLVTGRLYRDGENLVATAEILALREGLPDLPALRAGGASVLALAELLARDLRRQLPDVSRLTAWRDDRADLEQLTSASEEARLHHGLGLLALRQERPGQASEHFERAVAADPDFAMARADLARSLHLAGYGRRAREAATAGLEVAARLGPAAERQALILRAVWAELYYKSDEGRAATARLVELYPDEPAVIEQRARALFAGRLDPESLAQALEQAERALVLDPPNTRLGLLRASLLRSSRRLDDAARALDAIDARLAGADNLEGQAAAANERGRLLWTRQEYHAARERLEAAAELFARAGRVTSAADARLEAAMVSTLVEAGASEEAGRRIAAALEEAERVGSLRTRCEALSAGGAWRIRRGDYAAAIPLLQQAVDQARQLENDDLLVQPLANLGNLLVYLGRTAEAAPLLESAAEVAGNTGHRATRLASLKGLAQIREHAGDLAGAVEALSALTGGPTPGQSQETPDRMVSLARTTLASIECARGNLTAALEHAARAERDLRTLELAPDLAEALIVHARVLAALGRFAAAETSLAEARRIATSSNASGVLERCAIEAASALLDRGHTTEAQAELRRAGAQATGANGTLLACRIAAGQDRPDAESLCAGLASDADAPAAQRIEARAWRARALLRADRAAAASTEAAAAAEQAAAAGLRLTLAVAAGVIGGLPAAHRPADAAERVEAGRRAMAEHVGSAPVEDRAAVQQLEMVRLGGARARPGR